MKVYINDLNTKSDSNTTDGKYKYKCYNYIKYQIYKIATKSLKKIVE